MKKAVLKVMLGSIILEALLVCICILVGSFDDLSLQAVGSVAIIIGYSFLCLFYSRIYGVEKYKYIAISGAIVVGICALMCIIGVWELVETGEIYEKTLGTLNVVAGILVFISWLLSYVSDNKLFNKFKRISLSLITILGIFSIIYIWAEFEEGFISRLYYALVVLTVGSFSCSSILTKVYKKEMTDISIANDQDSPDEKKLESTEKVEQEIKPVAETNEKKETENDSENKEEDKEESKDNDI